jgi:two-component system, NtrC family, sensor kinase
LQKGATLEADLHPDMPMAFVDPDALKEVITSILTNAAEAINLDGCVSITSCWCKQFVVLSIQDNGVGMDVETMDKMFDPFFTTKAEVGRGFGASIARAYVKAWGGKIVVESAPDIGTKVMISVPVKSDS